MRPHSTTYYRLLVSSLLLMCAACAGFPDPLADDESPLSAVLGVEQTNAAVLENIGSDCLELGNPLTTSHRAMFDALNLYRAENGLSTLIYSKKLEAVADAHLRDTYSRGYFDHINPEGQGPADRAVAAGFCHEYVGENLAAGQRSVEAVMNAWKNSPGHDANMVHPYYVYVGMGFFRAPTGRLYWAQLFAYDVP